MFILICWTHEDLNKINIRDPEIFEKIYSKYKTKIFNFLIIKTKGNRDNAEEIFSQTFHSVFESAPGLKSVKSLQAWIFQIAKRRFIDYIRNIYKEKRYLNKLHEEKESDPFTDISSKEEILLFNIGFDKLPELNRKVLTLKYIDNKSQKEITEIINKSEKATESFLMRSKQLLKKELIKNKRFFND